MLSVIPSTQHVRGPGWCWNLGWTRRDRDRRQRGHDDEQFPRVPAQPHQPETFQRQRATYHVSFCHSFLQLSVQGGPETEPFFKVYDSHVCDDEERCLTYRVVLFLSRQRLMHLTLPYFNIFSTSSVKPYYTKISVSFKQWHLLLVEIGDYIQHFANSIHCRLHLLSSSQLMSRRTRLSTVGNRAFLVTGSRLQSIALPSPQLHRWLFFGAASKLTSFPDHFLPNCLRFLVLYTVYSSGLAVLYLGHCK